LCDFKSLKKGRSKADAANGSLRQKKIKTNGEIRLGDISSGSQSRSSEDSNSEDDREEHAGFQCENDLAKSLVLAATSDENILDSDVSELSEDNSKTPKKGKRGRENTDDVKRKSAKKQSALLSMKLSETDSLRTRSTRTSLRRSASPPGRSTSRRRRE